MNPLLIASLIGFPLLSTALLIMQRLTPRPIAEWATHPMKQHPSLITLGLATALCGCNPAPRITVKNDSPHTLSNLVVSGPASPSASPPWIPAPNTSGPSLPAANPASACASMPLSEPWTPENKATSSPKDATELRPWSVPT